MITFQEDPNNAALTHVRLEGKRVGVIWQERDGLGNYGYRYYAMGTGQGGERFDTLQQCKESL